MRPPMVSSNKVECHFWQLPLPYLPLDLLRILQHFSLWLNSRCILSNVSFLSFSLILIVFLKCSYYFKCFKNPRSAIHTTSLEGQLTAALQKGEIVIKNIKNHHSNEHSTIQLNAAPQEEIYWNKMTRRWDCDSKLWNKSMKTRSLPWVGYY